MKTVPVKVFWVSAADGGRSVLPDGLRYSTVSKWPDHPDVWSVVLECDRPPSEQGSPTLAAARFLVDEAPADRLVPGDSFELYEGRRKVADVQIV